jgi:NAD(P)-dependent dehydrogenase (short-subunit alcohol dehydrogenase family)
MTPALHGRTVAITGGGRGIGAATARALVAAGARVAIGDVDLATAQATAAAIGGSTLALPLDVTDRAGFVAFLDIVESTLGPLDVLVNNAGIMPLTRLLDEDEALTARVLAINVEAVVRGTREAVRRMLPRGSGHVVNVASTAGKADAIVAAIRKPRFEVYVPRSAGPLLWSTAMMPRRTREWVGRRMGVDHVFLDAGDDPERRAYEERARGH